MKHLMTSAFACLAMALPAYAQGDPEEGEKTFRKCTACHMIADGDETYVKGGRTGPNLYGMIGRTAGTVEDFDNYGDSLVAAGEAGLVWTEEELAEYVEDPRAYLQEYLDDKGAKSRMSLRLRKGQEDVAAYLATFGPEDAADDDTGEESETDS